MLLRLLILVILGVLVYRAARAWFGAGQNRSSRAAGGPPDTVDDEMIKDPECGVYFPQRNAVALADGDGVLYFCSIECRDRYMARQSDKASKMK